LVPGQGHLGLSTSDAFEEAAVAFTLEASEATMFGLAAETWFCLKWAASSALDQKTTSQVAQENSFVIVLAD